ncbi:MAG: hypothetical protein KBT11_06260 [Treponema sp.]|nr:hypothetical protein [Candidatus Treponema equifaecale]
MFKFYLKKNIADGWDNFFFLILSNIIPLLLVIGSYFAIGLAATVNPLAQAGAFILCAGLVSTSIFAWGANAAKIADFGTPTFSVFFSSIKYVWKIGLAFGAFLAIGFLVLRFGIAYYLAMYLRDGTKIGLLLTAVLAWFVLVCIIALQWFIPLYYLQESNGFVKCLKKSFIIFFDNAGFSVKVFFYNILLVALSVMIIGLVPGFCGILLSSTNALRLRLYKYDWFEKKAAEDPEFMNNRDKRDEVPWDELLSDDKESLGPRKLSSFLFPWK